MKNETKAAASKVLAEIERLWPTMHPEARGEVQRMVDGIYSVIAGCNRDFAHIALTLVSVELHGISARANDIIDITTNQPNHEAKDSIPSDPAQYQRQLLAAKRQKALPARTR